jgi:hypothetical protein
LAKNAQSIFGTQQSNTFNAVFDQGAVLAVVQEKLHLRPEESLQISPTNMLPAQL